VPMAHDDDRQGVHATRRFFGLGILTGVLIMAGNLEMATLGPDGFGSPWATLVDEPELWTYFLLPLLFGWLFGLTHRHLETRKERVRLSKDASERVLGLASANELLLGALTAAVDGIVLADPSGIIRKMDVGATDLLGVTADEAQGRNLKDVLGADPTGEVEVKRRDGSLAVVQVERAMVRVGDQQQAVYVLKDVGDRQAEQRSLAARCQELTVRNEIRKNFIAFLGQEIRSPMTAVTVLTQIVEEQAEELGRDDIVADTRQISKASQRVVRLADQILDLLKIEAGNLSFVVEPVELRPIVDTLIASTQGEITFRDVSLPDTIPPIIADRTRLAQIVLAMCEALHMATIGAGLDIAASPLEADRVVLTVRVVGHPAAARLVAGAFRDWQGGDEFDAGLFGMSPGFGLGLPLARRFAQLMGGELTLPSQDGLGLELRLVMPAAAAIDRAPAHAARSDVPVGKANSQSLSVLVVEGSGAMASILDDRPGITAHRADNYHDALNALSRIDPAVILLSMALPQSKSWLLLTTIKAHPALWHVPIVMVRDDPATGSVYVAPIQDVLLNPPAGALLERVSVGLSRGGGAEQCTVLFTADEVTARRALRHKSFQGVRIKSTADPSELRSWMAGRIDLLLLDLLTPARSALVDVCGLLAAGPPSGPVMGLLPAEPSSDQIIELSERMRHLHLQGAAHGAAMGPRLADAVVRARDWRRRLPEVVMPGTVLVSGLPGDRV
jgi:signal transduction histidine kinase/CheY-like chemotaxis protein